MHISNLDFIKTSPSQSVQFSFGIVGGRKRNANTIQAYSVAKAEGEFAFTFTNTKAFAYSF